MDLPVSVASSTYLVVEASMGLLAVAIVGFLNFIGELLCPFFDGDGGDMLLLTGSTQLSAFSWTFMADNNIPVCILVE